MYCQQSGLRNPPAAVKVLCTPEDLWNLKDGCVLLLASVFGPAYRVFTYRKVRKKKSHGKTTPHQHTENFCCLLECPLSVLPHFKSVSPPQNLYGLQLLSEDLHSFWLFQVRMWEVVRSALTWDRSGISCFCDNCWSLVEDMPWSHIKLSISTGIRK
jgi:hypothetical protein